MNGEKQKALEAAGWRSGDAADFLGMTEAERHELDLRVSLALAVRNRRERLGLSQKQLAARLKISKRTLDRIEWGGGEITLEQMLHAYTIMGGRLAIKELTPHSDNGAGIGAKRKKKATASA